MLQNSWHHASGCAGLRSRQRGPPVHGGATPKGRGRPMTDAGNCSEQLRSQRLLSVRCRIGGSWQGTKASEGRIRARARCIHERDLISTLASLLNGLLPCGTFGSAHGSPHRFCVDVLNMATLSEFARSRHARRSVAVMAAMGLVAVVWSSALGKPAAPPPPSANTDVAIFTAGAGWGSRLRTAHVHHVLLPAAFATTSYRSTQMPNTASSLGHAVTSCRGCACSRAQ